MTEPSHLLLTLTQATNHEPHYTRPEPRVQALQMFCDIKYILCPGRDLNPHDLLGSEGFKPSASADSATRAI